MSGAFAPGARTVQPPSSRSEQNAPRKSSEMTWSAVIGGGVDAYEAAAAAREAKGEAFERIFASGREP